jgi:hypothetical protein
MIRLKQIVTLVLVSCFTISASGLAQAQTPAPPAAPAAPATAASNDTMAAGLIDGEALGEGPGTGGKLGVGLAVGVLTGLIGTGIGYFVIGPDPLSPEALQRSAGKSADYQLGLKNGWEQKTRSRKRKAFLGGGLLGTAAFVAIYATATSSSR